MKRNLLLIMFSFALLSGCSGMDKNTVDYMFLKDYLTLRFETVNMTIEKDSDVYDSIEHAKLVKPFLTEDRYNEFTRKRESQMPLKTHDFTVVEGGTLSIQSIKVDKVKDNEYKYEVIVIIDNLTGKLKTTYSGHLKINGEGLIYYDWLDQRIGVTEKMD